MSEITKEALDAAERELDKIEGEPDSWDHRTIAERVLNAAARAALARDGADGEAK